MPRLLLGLDKGANALSPISTPKPEARIFGPWLVGRSSLGREGGKGRGRETERIPHRKIEKERERETVRERESESVRGRGSSTLNPIEP